MRTVPWGEAAARNDRRQRPRLANLLAVVALAAGLWVSTAGCESIAGQGNTLPRLSASPSVKTSGEAFKKKVEADSFPTASQAGIR